MADALISKGALINAQTSYGSTALRFWSEGYRSGLVVYLVTRGADIRQTDHNGFTALHVAAEVDALEVVQFLVSKGVPFEARSRYSETPLHRTTIVAKSDGLCTSNLLKCGANIEAIAEFNGLRAIHIAIWHDNHNVAKVLISKGADIEAEIKSRWSPLHLAMFHGRHTIVELLLQKGANISALTEDGRRPSEIGWDTGSTDRDPPSEKHKVWSTELMNEAARVM